MSCAAARSSPFCGRRGDSRQANALAWQAAGPAPCLFVALAGALNGMSAVHCGPLVVTARASEAKIIHTVAIMQGLPCSGLLPRCARLLRVSVNAPPAAPSHPQHPGRAFAPHSSPAAACHGRRHPGARLHHPLRRVALERHVAGHLGREGRDARDHLHRAHLLRHVLRVHRDAQRRPPHQHHDRAHDKDLRAGARAPLAARSALQSRWGARGVGP